LKPAEVITGIKQGSGNVIVKTNSRYLIWGDATAGQYFYTDLFPIKLPIEILVPGKSQYKIAEPVLYNGQASSTSSMILISDGCTYPVPTIVHNNNVTCPANNQAYIFSNTYYNGIMSVVPQPISANFSNMMITAAQAGTGFVTALSSSGVLYTWGTNYNSTYYYFHLTAIGNLGDGTTNSRATPTPVLADATSALNNRYIVEVACKYRTCLVLTNDNTLVAWGYYARSTSDSTTPVIIPPGAIETREVWKITTGYTFHYVLTKDNLLFSWGNFVSLGDVALNQTTGYRFIPHPVTMDGALYGKTVSSIYAGGNLAAVITIGLITFKILIIRFKTVSLGYFTTLRVWYRTRRL
jgi:alpha-tubulin suppressor-like RCC1 family protein